jgi:hypothetical protein
LSLAVAASASAGGQIVASHAALALPPSSATKFRREREGGAELSDTRSLGWVGQGRMVWFVAGSG